MNKRIRVTVWNENRHEQKDPNVQKVYPEGIHKLIASFLSEHKDIQVTTATLDEPDHGLSDDVLNNTDVLIWWAHIAHDEVDDRVVERVHRRMLNGMGFIALHSAHMSKTLRKALGTNCSLKWREVAERERIWTIEPSHPIAEGVGECIVLPNEEMYGERFDVPAPDELVFVSWFEGGEVFRSGCCWQRGHGRIFFFQPGHETYPTYYHQGIQRVIANAVRWAAPRVMIDARDCPNVGTPPEKVEKRAIDFSVMGKQAPKG